MLGVLPPLTNEDFPNLKLFGLQLSLCPLACYRQPLPCVSLCILSAPDVLVLGHLQPPTNEVPTNLRLFESLGLQLSYSNIKGVATLALCLPAYASH